MWHRIKALFERRSNPSRPLFMIHKQYEIDICNSPYDMRRPFKILSYLERRKFLQRGMLKRPRPATFQQLLLVHDIDYLRSLEQPGALTPIVGSPLEPNERDPFLQAQRVMCGGTIHATFAALKDRKIAVNLGGGFHHASTNKGSGLCAFNDIAVAIAMLRAKGYDFPILVIDLDIHDGDGTRSIFAKDASVFTFSIHNQDLGSTEAEASKSIALGADIDDQTYLETIEKHLPSVFADFKPEMVFYIAGSDPMINDKLGNWCISLEGLVQRDRYVIGRVNEHNSSFPETAATNGLPCVILLAGGYGRSAWRHGASFFSWILTGNSNLEIPLELELPVNHYRRLTKLMKNKSLLPEESDSSQNDWGLTDEDFSMVGIPIDNRFLGLFTQYEIEWALEEVGLMERLRQRGFDDLRALIGVDDPLGHTLSVKSGRKEPVIVLEAKLRIDRGSERGRSYLSVEWLLIQDARVRFELSRPLLPGQKYPGLGLLRDTAAALIVMAERLDLDGLVFTPSHFHLAYFSMPLAFYTDPVEHGRFLALRRAVKSLRIDEAAKAVHSGQVTNLDTGEILEWVPARVVIPVSSAMKEHFNSKAYQDQVAVTSAEFNFSLSQE